MVNVGLPLKRLRAALLFLLSLGFVLSLAVVAPAQAAREVTWEDLQPTPVEIQDPMEHLPPEQYADMGTLARIRWWIETGEVSTDGPDAKRAQELTQSLKKQGVDVDGVLAELDAARAQWLQQTESINVELDGQPVKLAGFVLPLDVSASLTDMGNGEHDEAKVQASQEARLRTQADSQLELEQTGKSGQAEPAQTSRFLLVPYLGACIHVPPPAANQMVYVEPNGDIEKPGLFDRVWLEGNLRKQSGTYSLYLVDGVRDVSASYALDLKAISPYIPEGAGLFDFGTTNFGRYEGPWWQTIQAQSSALVTGTLVNMRDRRSPAAFALGIGIAFAYGVIHTLGPGHGKAIIVSYFVGEGGSFRKGVAMGARVAIFHVFSAILVAVLTDVVVRQTVGSAPGSYRIVRLLSYGSIAAIGAWMLWKATQPQPAFANSTQVNPSGTLTAANPANPLSPNLMSAVLEEDNQLNIQHQFEGDCGCYSCIDPKRSGNWLSLAIGAVPCSGALLVLIYGLANNLLWPAVLMVISISLGMAIALSGIGVAALWGRQFANRQIAQGGSDRKQQRLFQALRIAGAVCVLLIGTFLFGFTLSSPTLPMLAMGL